MVQLLGIPLGPKGQDDIDAALTNVPEEATPETQLPRQLVAEIFVARHLI